MAGNRPLPTDVAMSSFSQSGANSTSNVPTMFGEVAKTVTIQGPYNAQQSSSTSEVVQVWADYGLYDATAQGNLDSNSTNFKDPF